MPSTAQVEWRCLKAQNVATPQRLRLAARLGNSAASGGEVAAVIPDEASKGPNPVSFSATFIPNLR